MSKTMIDIMPIKCCKAQASSKLSSFKFVLLLFASLFVCLVLEVKDSFEDDIRSTFNVHSNTNTNTETVKIGNTKTKNYNIQESNYLPTQLTQVVVNVPKLKKLRKLRPPTEEEFMIKRKILDIYDETKRELGIALSLVNSQNEATNRQQVESESITKRIVESKSDLEAKTTTTTTTSPDSTHAALVSTANAASKHLNHLGKIIQALNPKYIATERVRSIAFADSNSNLDAVAASFPPLSEPETVESKQQQQAKLVSLELTGQQRELQEEQEVEESLEEFLSDQLDTLDEKFRDLFVWDQSFIEALENVGDEKFSQTQLAYKQLILCLNDPNLCVISTKSDGNQHQQQQHELELLQQQQQHQAQDQDSETDLDSDTSSEAGDEEEEEDEIDERYETRRPDELKQEVVDEQRQDQILNRQQQQQLQTELKHQQQFLSEQKQHKLGTGIQDAIDDSDEDEKLYSYQHDEVKDYTNDRQQAAEYGPPGFNMNSIPQQRTLQHQQQRAVQQPLPQPQPQYQPRPQPSTAYQFDTAAASAAATAPTNNKQDRYLNKHQNPYEKPLQQQQQQQQQMQPQQISAIREPTKSLINRSNRLNLSRLNEFKNFFAQQQLMNGNSNSEYDNRYRNQQQLPQQKPPVQRQPLTQQQQQQFNFGFNQQPVLRSYQQQQPQQRQRYHRNLQANE